MTNSVPAWLPDWVNSAAYPKPGDLSPTLWAWQFIRRNPEYQEAHRVCEAATVNEIIPITDETRHAMNIIQNKFGMVLACNPAETTPDFALSDLGRPNAFQTLGTPAEIAFVLNLEWPIERQLAEVKRVVISERQRLKKSGAIKPVSPRNIIAHCPEYIRYLDARTVGASIGEIADTIHPNLPLNRSGDGPRVDRVKKGLKRAESLRDRDFYLIILAQ